MIRYFLGVDWIGKLLKIWDYLEKVVASWVTAALSWLEHLDTVESIFWLLDDEGEIGVCMKTKDFRSIDIRKNSVNCQHEIFNGVTVQAVVGVTIWVIKFLTSSCEEKVRIEAFFQGAHKTNPIKIISNSSSVIDVSYHVPDCVPVDIFPTIIEEII